jgi:polysaccharide export outer membrane protein
MRCVLGAALLAVSGVAFAQGSKPAPVAAPLAKDDAEFVIGPEDILTILFWREKEMSGDVTVRPDGVITLPLINEVRAAGWTPTALAGELQKIGARYLTDPVVTVMVKQINSRQVYITGEVNSPGAYPLTGPRTVMQLLSLAGGVLEFAKTNEITVLRQEGQQTRAFRFNYENVSRGQSLEQNLELRPGDTVVVP